MNARSNQQKIQQSKWKTIMKINDGENFKKTLNFFLIYEKREFGVSISKCSPRSSPGKQDMQDRVDSQILGP